MRLLEFARSKKHRLDTVLADCLELLFEKQLENPRYWGLVAAAVVDPEDTVVFGVNHLTKDGTRKHAERVAIENYEEKFGPIPEGSRVVTTLSPCAQYMAERWGPSCTKMLDDSVIKQVYTGYLQPSQTDTDDYRHKEFHVEVTRNSGLQKICQTIGQIIDNKSKNS